MMAKEKSTFFHRRFNTIYITILIVIFCLGFILGWMFTDDSISKTDILLKNSELDIRSINEKINFVGLFGENACDTSVIDQLGTKLSELGKTLQQLDANKSINSEDYKYLKQKYNINEVLYYTTYKSYVEKCNMTPDIVLFFFNDNQTSKDQGAVLDNLVLNNTRLKVISMDYNYTPSLDYFYQYYNTDTLPSLIINFNTQLNGLSDEQQIKDILNQH